MHIIFFIFIGYLYITIKYNSPPPSAPTLLSMRFYVISPPPPPLVYVNTALLVCNAAKTADTAL